MFKTGQIVWCKIRGKYYQTDYHVKCRVVEYDATVVYDLVVCILEGQYAGNTWSVEGKDFVRVGGQIV